MKTAKAELRLGTSGDRKSLIHLNLRKSVPGLKRDKLGKSPSEIR